MYAFLSYQTDDKKVAGAVKLVLDELNIDSFLAHEDIHVSAQWRDRILEEIGQADVFVAILSKSYAASTWCIQESGIASFRSKKMAIVPLSLDGTIPMGFFGHIQSIKINPASVNVSDLLPGLATADFDFVFELLAANVKRSGSYRSAEANFERLIPFLKKASKKQIVKLLTACASNGQVSHALLCASKYIPPLMKSHGRYLDSEARQRLQEALDMYAS